MMRTLEEVEGANAAAEPRRVARTAIFIMVEKKKCLVGWTTRVCVCYFSCYKFGNERNPTTWGNEGDAR